MRTLKRCLLLMTLTWCGLCSVPDDLRADIVEGECWIERRQCAGGYELLQVVPVPLPPALVLCSTGSPDGLDLDYELDLVDLGLSEGDYRVGFRFRDSAGEWGCLQYRPIHVRRSGLEPVVAEYFVDDGAVTTVPPLSAGGAGVSCSAPGTAEFEISIDTLAAGLSPGEHTLNIRFQNNDLPVGQWSPWRAIPFVVRGGGQPGFATVVPHDPSLPDEDPSSPLNDPPPLDLHPMGSLLGESLLSSPCVDRSEVPVNPSGFFPLGLSRIEIHSPPGASVVNNLDLQVDPHENVQVLHVPDCGPGASEVGVEWTPVGATSLDDRVEIWLDDSTLLLELDDAAYDPMVAGALMVPLPDGLEGGVHSVRVSRVRIDNSTLDGSTRGIGYWSEPGTFTFASIEVTFFPATQQVCWSFEDGTGTVPETVELFLDGQATPVMIWEGETEGCAVAPVPPGCSQFLLELVATDGSGEVLACGEHVHSCGTLFLRGDADDDGIFNGLTDGIYILSYQFSGGDEPPCLESADADGDGVFNGLTDGLWVLSHQFIPGAPPPVAPFPACGPDPDPSTSLGCGGNGC